MAWNINFCSSHFVPRPLWNGFKALNHEEVLTFRWLKITEIDFSLRIRIWNKECSFVYNPRLFALYSFYFLFMLLPVVHLLAVFLTRYAIKKPESWARLFARLCTLKEVWLLSRLVHSHNTNRFTMTRKWSGSSMTSPLVTAQYLGYDFPLRRCHFEGVWWTHIFKRNLISFSRRGLTADIDFISSVHSFRID